MIKINEFKKAKKLNELFQGWKYKLPKDPELILYDFYFITVILKGSIISDDTLEFIFDETVNEVVDELYLHMNRAMKYSLACEIRHIFDINFNPAFPKAQNAYKKHPEFTLEYYNNLKKERTSQDLPDFLSSISKAKTANFDEFGERLRYSIYKSNSKDRLISYRAIKLTQKNLGISDLQLSQIYEDFMNSGSWKTAYGGPAWATIASGWQKLIRANKLNDKIIYIDHCYDLQHNTDTVFNKIKMYYKDSSGYKWLKNALDWKRDINDMRQFYDRVSPQLKPIVAYVAKNSYGLTIQGYKELDKPKTSMSTTSSSGSGSNMIFNYVTILSHPGPLNTNFKAKYNFIELCGLEPIDNIYFTEALINAIAEEIHKSSSNNLADIPLVNILIELLKSVRIKTPKVVFGTPNKKEISLKMGTLVKKGGDLPIYSKIDVYPGASITTPQTMTLNPATDAPPPKPFGDKPILVKSNLFSHNVKYDWLKKKGWYSNINQWSNTESVYISPALLQLANEKYTKIKWMFNLTLKNVYMHYNRAKDEIIIEGKGIGNSKVEGWFKKGTIKDCAFGGTFQQGEFIGSSFISGTFINGNFVNSVALSGSNWVKGKLNGVKGLIPTNFKKVEASSVGTFNEGLDEENLERLLNSRPGWV